MQELNMNEVSVVSGAAWKQVSGYVYYVLSGGKIIMQNDETGEKVVLDYGNAK